MPTIAVISIFTIDLISLFITFPGYMFILVVNILDWWKNKRLDISDQLISGIGLFNLFHRFFYASLNYIIFTDGFLTILHLQDFINILYLSLIFCILFFSTLLAIHFCLKIVNINHKVYIYIQRTFPKIFPWILLLSIFASVLLSVPAALQLAFPNSTDVKQTPDYSFSKISFYSAISFLCFLLLFISALNIMQNNAMNFRAEIVQVCHVLGVPILIRGNIKMQKKLKQMKLYCSFLNF
ncbi:hypothetical protein GDO81_025254 [Engystomops pustulosus]|uniref:Uncharacterized protein n=1 Tax=Engystomops pustulosus TaxID=76066 RepID=A0AAV6ZQF4_ENGPU|nr:hypothetical protein GDO81_025254 [Engystomops pustulosus]